MQGLGCRLHGVGCVGSRVWSFECLAWVSSLDRLLPTLQQSCRGPFFRVQYYYNHNIFWGCCDCYRTGAVAQVEGFYFAAHAWMGRTQFKWMDGQL